MSLPVDVYVASCQVQKIQLRRNYKPRLAQKVTDEEYNQGMTSISSSSVKVKINNPLKLGVWIV